MFSFLRRCWPGLVALGLCCVQAGSVTPRNGQGYTGLVKVVDDEHLRVGPVKGPSKRIALKDVVTATFDVPVDPELFEAGAPKVGKGYGLLAAYHDRPNFKGRVIYRIDQTVNHQGRSRQPVFDLPRDYFSVRWSGELEPPVTGEYTFTLHANAGGKLTVGELALGRWEALSGFREVGKVSLKAGERVPFAFEFFDNYGAGSARATRASGTVAWCCRRPTRSTKRAALTHVVGTRTYAQNSGRTVHRRRTSTSQAVL